MSDKLDKFLRHPFTLAVVQSGLIAGIIALTASCMAQSISDKNLKDQIMTQYVQEMSALILDEKIYKHDVDWDDVNEEILVELVQLPIVQNKLLDDENELSELPGVDIDKLKKSPLGKPVYYNANALHNEKKSIARAITLNTLRRLENNGELKGQVVKFLYESKLIGHCNNPKDTSQGFEQEESQSKSCPEAIIELGDANFSEAEISKAIVELQGLNLTRSNLQGANFSRTNLSKSSFVRSRLNKAKFYKADLSGANFEGACLMGTDFTGAFGMNPENFNGAHYNQSTVFPDAFKESEGFNKLLQAKC